ncbi:MAG: hypothetical protein SGCHY_000254 [Lobulomycetales sp.]
MEREREGDLSLARRLEQSTEEKLARLGSLPLPAPGSALQAEIDNLLSQRKSNLRNLPPSHRRSRHQDILDDHIREYSQLKQLSARQALVIPIKDNSTSSNSWQDNAYLSERSRIDSSHALADQVLQQAYETQESLNMQHSLLSNAQGRMTAIASRIPVVNTLLGRIKSKKTRDTVVLGFVISCCICVLFLLAK